MAQRIIPIAMPKWGMEMVEGQIAKWSKREGDPVSPGEDLIDIETDKMTNVYESEYTGILRRRLAKEGEIYPVGQLLGVIADASVSDEEIESFVQSYKGPQGAVQEPAAAPTPAPPPPPPQAPVASYLPREQVPTRTMTEQPKASRAVAGARVSSASVEAQLKASGAEISPIAVRVAVREGVDLGRVQATGRLGRISLKDLETAAGRRLGARAGQVSVSPRARRLAREFGIAIETVRGSGRDGRIHAEDVVAARQQVKPARSAPSLGQASIQVGPAGYRSEANSAMRRTIARRLVQSKATAPHIYLRTSVTVTELMRLRAGINKRHPEAKVSVNDLIVRASGLALIEEPGVNVQYTDESLLYFDQADISVAIALPQGLVAPVIRGVDRKPVTQIGEEIRAAAARARSGELTRNDLEGGTFSVSNLGMYGIESFDAVINPPQSAILAVGAITDRAVGEHGHIRMEPTMALSLSCDHRAIDGATGARYLAALKDLLENPVSLVM